MKLGSLFAGVGGFDLGFERAGFETKWVCEWDKDCQHILRRHFPNAKLYGDITAVDPAELEKVDCITYGFPCFVAGTLILTRQGLTRIENVKVGDEVYTHANRWRRVNSTMSRRAPTVTMKGGFHPHLQTTHEHPFFASEGRTKKFFPQSERRRGHWHTLALQPPQWVNAESMQGRYWATPILGGNEKPRVMQSVKPKKGVTSKSCEITTELMWVAGAWLGDGWLRRRKDRGGNTPTGVVICAPPSLSDELHERLKGAGLRTTKAPDRTVNKFIVSKRALAEWLFEHFGEYCDGKRLPGWLYECGEEYRRAFLDGYVWADGCEKNGLTRTSSVSRELSFGIALLMTGLGMTASVYKSRTRLRCMIEGRSCEQKTAWAVHAKGFKKQTSAFVIDRHSFSKCRSVTNSAPETVFNLSVQDDESYVADGLVVHNCTDLSIAGKRKGLKHDGENTRSGLFFEAIRIIQHIQPRLACFENVPGLLSSSRGRDFAVVLRELARIGYGETVYVTLDSQHFGVAQRRRRVFGISAHSSCPGLAVKCAEEIHAQSKGVCRDLATGEETREGTAADVEDRAGAGGELCPPILSKSLKTPTGGIDREDGHTLIPEITGSLACNTGPNGHDAGNFASNQGVDSGCLIPEISKAITAERDGYNDGSYQTYIPETSRHREREYIPNSVGALTDGAHNGGGLNGQDAYTGRIIAERGVGLAGTGREGKRQQHEAGTPDCGK